VRVVVIGVGSRDRSDDGVGPAVADLVRKRATEGLDVVTSSGDPVDLIDAWSEAELAIVVDALVPHAEPGRVLRFDATRQPLRTGLFVASSHELGVAHAVELARALAVLPPRLVVFGIEAGGFELGAPLSPAVARAVSRVADQVLAEACAVGATR
jgi:hydrogenase maturation protease